MRKAVTAIAIILLVAAFGAVALLAARAAYDDLFDPEWTATNIDAATADAERIVAALERYRSEHGRYPADLAELVPAYIDPLPLPATGHPHWFYEPSESGSRFSLAFAANAQRYPTCWITSASGEWQRDE